MGDFTLTPAGIRAGHYEAILTTRGRRKKAPALELRLLDTPVANLTVTAEPDLPNCWSVRVKIDPELLNEGVQTFLVRDIENNETLDSFAIAAGLPLSGDLLAEITLIRAELEMLKQAFRQHCITSKG